jgi:hypothetical protein
MRFRLVVAVAMLAVVPAAASSAAPAAERRAAAAEVDVLGSDGASYRIEILLTQVLPTPEAVLDASVTRCAGTDCATTTTRRVIKPGEFQLDEQGTAAWLKTRAFGAVVSVAWQGGGTGSTTLLTTRAGRSSAGAAVQETTRPASARVEFAGLRCGTRQAHLQQSAFAGAGDTVTERPIEETPRGLLPAFGRTPRCSAS